MRRARARFVARPLAPRRRTDFSTLTGSCLLSGNAGSIFDSPLSRSISSCITSIWARTNSRADWDWDWEWDSDELPEAEADSGSSWSADTCRCSCACCGSCSLRCSRTSPPCDMDRGEGAGWFVSVARVPVDILRKRQSDKDCRVSWIGSAWSRRTPLPGRIPLRSLPQSPSARRSANCSVRVGLARRSNGACTRIIRSASDEAAGMDRNHTTEWRRKVAQGQQCDSSINTASTARLAAYPCPLDGGATGLCSLGDRMHGTITYLRVSH